MDTSEAERPSQHIGKVESSAVSNSGVAINNNFQGGYYHVAAPSQPWTPPLLLPPRAQSFVGRDEDITWLLEHLTSEDVVILGICGPGGMGKTALAAEALKRLMAQKDWQMSFPDGIFYHSFYTYPSLNVAFEELARVFGGEPGGDPYLAARRAISHRRALLVFDGVEVLADADARALRELGGMNRVLVLSRRRSDVPDHAHRRDLGVLSQAQAIKLLQEVAGHYAADRQSVVQLVQYISGYPLALQLIGSHLSSFQEEITDYLHWFEDEGLVATHFGEHQVESIQILLQRTYDVLPDHAQQMFLLLGLLAPAPFPLVLIQEILALPERVVRQTTGSLINLSVLRRSDPIAGYEVSHPLIHTFSMEHLSSQEHTASSPFLDLLSIWHERLLTMLITHFEQSNLYDAMDLALWQPHVLFLLPVKDVTIEQSLKMASLFNAVGNAASAQGKYGEAGPLYVRALAIREQELGATHPDTATSLNNLALLYRDQGKYGEAEPLYVRALAIREQELGATHPDTATSLNNLAGLYRDQGKYGEAEPLYVRALVIREQELGATHPSTATSLNNLAGLYQAQGKYGEAEPLLKRALGICEQELGATHPSTATSLNNLAGLYRAQGKYGEAEPLLKRALGICEQELGATHPSTATSLNNLAGLYRDQGKYGEAEPLYVRALGICEQELGATHPDTARSLNNLALLYRDQGKYGEAEPLYVRALGIREQELGATHPDTALSLNNLALLYRAQGKYGEAEPLLKRALGIYEQELGATHPDTARSLNNLAALYRDQGKYREAEPLLKRALAIYEQALGATHPSTQIIGKNYALVRQKVEEEADQGRN